MHSNVTSKIVVGFTLRGPPCNVGIGDINSVDEHGNPVMVSNNVEKPDLLGNYFLSIFTIEQELSSTAIPHVTYHSW